MAMYKGIEQELNDAKVRLDKAMKNLKTFEEGENDRNIRSLKKKEVIEGGEEEVERSDRRSSVIARKDIKEVVEFAKCKLLEGYQLLDLTKSIEYIFKDEENRFTVSLAILSCFVSLDILTQSQLTHLLVGSYIDTCIGISKSKENILTMYSSEPILSEVALQIIKIETNRRFIFD
ncbi:5135_t:CDS:2 [Funneliformis mosseae]|uniref:5135_t:CDS:1 n=1 Tax=Funneliformis mosseae TaxID=27381 RepID=A0A9N9C709_FUNMO|nr:5135_t:CDS:2 [Funneliformis mosseae]